MLPRGQENKKATYETASTILKGISSFLDSEILLKTIKVVLLGKEQ